MIEENCNYRNSFSALNFTDPLKGPSAKRTCRVATCLTCRCSDWKFQLKHTLYSWDLWWFFILTIDARPFGGWNSYILFGFHILYIPPLKRLVFQGNSNQWLLPRYSPITTPPCDAPLGSPRISTSVLAWWGHRGRPGWERPGGVALQGSSLRKSEDRSTVNQWTA